VKIIMQARACPSLENLSNVCMESMDFLLNFAAEADKSHAPDQVRMLIDMTSSNGQTMEQLRKSYMTSDKLSSANDKGCLLDLTMAMEKIIWLLNRLASLTPVVQAPQG
jgi:hypothetical protein